METVKKRPSLRRVLAGYLVLTGGLCLLAAVLWWTGLSFLMRAGVIQPANQMAETAYQAKTAVEAAGTLPPDRLPAGCRYLLLGPEGTDAFHQPHRQPPGSRPGAPIQGGTVQPLPAAPAGSPPDRRQRLSVPV